MGSLSRTFDSWRNHVHLHARNLGPGGQMLTLMHEELESGFNQMNDAVGHLAWVQQQAHEEQLTAQYRVMQLQADTIGELGRANESLAVMSTQLAEVADILRELKGTQDEHLQIVKAERTLKEVLFQLSTMLEDMIIPEDEVARLCLCQFALDSLDHHSLNTSHLSDLADKREFAAFVKKTRQTVRDTPPDVQSDLLAFEVWYKRYSELRDLWNSADAPLYVPRAAPKWSAGVEPVLKPKIVPSKPKARANPGDHPLPEKFGKMPGDIFVNGKLTPYPYQVVTPGTFTPDTVPSQADTQKRLSQSNKGFMQFLDSVFASSEWANARRFEEALRDWAVKARRYGQYVAALAKWEESVARVHKFNHDAAESHRIEVEKFRKAESERRKEHEAACARYANEECEERKAWDSAFEIVSRAFASQGREINAFLDEHPDAQRVYRKVDWERDTAAMRRRAKEETMPVGSNAG